MRDILTTELIKKGIYWTDTWNPIKRVGGGYGCTKVSPACNRCWAEGINNRFHGSGFNQPHHEFELDERILTKPLAKNPEKHKKPQIYATQWMGDLFHHDVPFEFIARIMDIMASAQCRNHIFLPLTKRPERIGEFLDWYKRHWTTDLAVGLSTGVIGKSPDNIIMGVTVEDNEHRYRIDELCKNWSGRKMVSFEPLLGAVDLDREWGAYENGNNTAFRKKMLDALDWVIPGCESLGGRLGRTAELEAYLSIVRQCREAGVPCFVKQLPIDGRVSKDMSEWPEELRVRQIPEIGKDKED